MTITREVGGDTFIISTTNGRVLVTKNDKQDMTFSLEQAKKIGAALLTEGAIQNWKSK